MLRCGRSQIDSDYTVHGYFASSVNDTLYARRVWLGRDLKTPDLSGFSFTKQKKDNLQLVRALQIRKEIETYGYAPYITSTLYYNDYTVFEITVTDSTNPWNAKLNTVEKRVNRRVRA